MPREVILLLNLLRFLMGEHSLFAAHILTLDTSLPICDDKIKIGYIDTNTLLCTQPEHVAHMITPHANYYVQAKVFLAFQTLFSIFKKE